MPSKTADTDRGIAIQAIRDALRERSPRGRWSVRGGTGTAWGWIDVTAPPARRDNFDMMTDDDRDRLAQLFGLRRINGQGISIPPQQRDQYVARARGEIVDGA